MSIKPIPTSYFNSDWMFIGRQEDWIGQGMTEEQMMNRIAELNLPAPPFCVLQPYYLNYMQAPDTNKIVVKSVQDVRDNLDDKNQINEWIASSNLWTPGQTINIVFANSSFQDFIKAALLKYLQPNISMKLAFPGGSQGDIMVTVLGISGAGGYSNVGKMGGQQNVQLGSANMSSSDISILTGVPQNSTTRFNWAKYTALHEFGHAMGLWHEWNREMCGRNGVTCSSTQDSYSVMNYPAGSSGGASDARPSAQCMDEYSQMDRQWLNTVYKGPGTTIGKSMPPPGTSTTPSGTSTIKTTPSGTSTIKTTPSGTSIKTTPKKSQVKKGPTIQYKKAYDEFYDTSYTDHYKIPLILIIIIVLIIMLKYI